MWDFIKKAGAALFSPKQTTQQLVRQVLEQPVQQAAEIAATTAAKKAAEHAKPMVDQVVNIAADAIKARVLKEGKGIVAAGAAQVHTMLQTGANAAREHTQTANSNVQTSIFSKFANMIAIPFKVIATTLATGLKKESSKAAKKVSATIKNAVKQTGDYGQMFVNGLLNTVVNYVSKSFSYALNSLVKAFLGLFINLDGDKKPTMDDKASESKKDKPRKSYAKKGSLYGPKPHHRTSPMIRLRDLHKAKLRTQATSSEVENEVSTNPTTRNAAGA